MSEAVKRYWLESYVDGFYKARQFVLASDHDRIVVGLQAQVERLAAKRDQWQREAIRLASAVCTLGKMEFDQLTDDSKLIEVMSVIREAIQERDTLRAEVERLKSLLKEAGEELEELKVAVGFRAHTLDVIQRIDEALDEYDRAVIEAGTEPSVK